MARFINIPFLLVSFVLHAACGHRLLTDNASNEPQCTGKYFDLSRLVTFGEEEGDETVLEDTITQYGSWFPKSDRFPVTLPGLVGKDTRNTSNSTSRPGRRCSVERLRAEERMSGVPVYGANMVLTYNDCKSGDGRDSFIFRREHSIQRFLNDFQMRDVRGKRFTDVHVEEGYSPTYTAQQAAQAISTYYGISVDAIRNTPKVYVFPAKPRDYLAYFCEVSVVKEGSFGSYRVILDAHSLEFLSICTRVDPIGGLPASPEQPGRNLRRSNQKSHDRHLQSVCQSCSTPVDLDDQGQGGNVECDIHSLYLDNSKRTTCTEWSVTGGMDTVDITYEDASIHWGGTFDCHNSNNGRNCIDLVDLVPLPNCPDAISDIQYGGIRTMNYLRDTLNVLGGFSLDAFNPRPVKAMAHFDFEYCNAFFSAGSVGKDVVAFGDCRCDVATPLVSLDIVAHEIMHGVTEYSSGLEYSSQSGGMNEGYSDILGTVMEFVVDDSYDIPDLTVGEKIGFVVRDMENPFSPQVDAICDFNEGLAVHYSSGILNKAWVKTVRACEADGCLTLSECVLMIGPLFLYTNIQVLTTFSTFDDAALETCRIVPEFLLSVSGYSSCSEAQIKQFVILGFAAVGITIDGIGCNTARYICSGTINPTREPSATPSMVPSVSMAPSEGPSGQPSFVPSMIPSRTPSSVPSLVPSKEPSEGPSGEPSVVPSMIPSNQPSISLQPSSAPVPAPTPPTPSPPTPGPPPACFSNIATLQMQNKGVVSMEQLMVGNRVLTANGYQEVYGFAHNDNVTQATFLQIHTREHKPLEISGEHLVFLAGRTAPVRADSVAIGDDLRDDNYGATVTKIDSVSRRGLYAPLTCNGNLIVDGIESSCYVSLQRDASEFVEFQEGMPSPISQHFMVHMTLAPVRILCFGVSSDLCKNGIANFVRMGFAISEFSDKQACIVQIVIFFVHVAVFGSCHLLECIFGPKFALLAVLLLGPLVKLLRMHDRSKLALE